MNNFNDVFHKLLLSNRKEDNFMARYLLLRNFPELKQEMEPMESDPEYTFKLCTRKIEKVSGIEFEDRIIALLFKGNLNEYD